ncbi:MAG: phosphoglycerate dehydrogenase [Candidatus Thermofonsia Clade 1 bacterium]|jgi:D-3-phosphoglycerate dehydrogenase|uniref:2-oxoglutarate reductase n=1 Tax=Candidatus Thermofonsia Clade 1 bacterium TaxID=2364210 RepID=A0A2M8PZB7_9CHLR|nr:MAG: phosphoglycerate dehydrogenase [Candidatus Thermofonsia Clade 1 bacterium]PJF42888.1 MAG: phosphoglycerate dehydrogenase [Candidatus Thermofonsia Clade 1 bacterium]RMF51378.1 MAG: phosphoglycerate dehydrogenase [Chloroflexota bacterium]
MYHILVPDNLDKAGLKLLEAAEGVTVQAAAKMSREEVLAAIPNADALIIRSATKVDRAMLEAAPKLKLIGRAGVGVDNVDLAAATERGIVVMNAPDGNTVATAELAIGLMLALARHIPAADGSLKAGQWERKAYMGIELRGKTLGLVGFGRVGRAVAKRAAAFEMTIIAYDPYVSQEVATPYGVQMVSLDELYARADFISLHASVTPENYHMINAESIAKMKDGVRIVNDSRGALIDEHALAEAIKSGKVAGAALDVYEEEPPKPDNPLIGLRGVIHTPHLGASTYEAQDEVAVQIAQQVLDALFKGVYRNVVNPEVLKGA